LRNFGKWLDNLFYNHFDQYGREVGISLFAFFFLLLTHSFQSAIVIAVVILWHEYGHLVAYRTTGRKGNRMMLVPFFGGVAVASAPHKNEYERALSALGGPAISVAITLPAIVLQFVDIGPGTNQVIKLALYYCSILNLLNLLPIFILDGGYIADAFLRTYIFHRRRLLIKVLTVIGLAVVFFHGQITAFFLLCFMAHSALSNYSATRLLPAMSRTQSIKIASATALTVLIHGFGYFMWLKLPRVYF
jgi:Zn-dependent protease